MSDFITRLVERALGLRETVQPNLTPIFGDGPAGEDASFMTAEPEKEETKPDEESNTSEFSPTGMSSWKEEAPFDRSGMSETAGEGRADCRIPEARQNYSNEDESVKSDINIETDASNIDPVQETGIDLKVKTVTLHTPEESRIHLDSTGDIELKASNSTQTEGSERMKPLEKGDSAAAEPVAANSPSPKSKKSALPEGKSQDSHKREGSSDLSISERLIRPDLFSRRPHSASDVRPSLSPEQRESPAPPSIKVTIGRIDVRAVNEPEKTQRAERRTDAKPRLSLDDYLKQRNRGQR